MQTMIWVLSAVVGVKCDLLLTKKTLFYSTINYIFYLVDRLVYTGLQVVTFFCVWKLL